MLTTRTHLLVSTSCLAAVLSTSCAEPVSVEDPVPSASVLSTSRTAAASSTTSNSSTHSSAPTPTCAALAASLTMPQRVGQLLMVGVSSGGLTTRDRGVLAKSQAGSVIFLGNSRAGATQIRRLTRSARAATATPRKIRTLLAVDQEGGKVQRLRGRGFSTMPSALQQAKMSNTKLAQNARVWGRQLKAVGIDADLAPVADVVPRHLVSVNQPIGVLKRGYGPDPSVVARKAGAFVRGMDRAGVATSAKHYPGLGRVRGNTDFSSKVVDSTTTRADASLRGFSGAISARVDMVMASSAYYAKIDRNRRAVFSPIVLQQMLRGDQRFKGVIISDDLSARAVLDLAPGERAVRFLRAGGDLIIVGDPRSVSAMTSAIVTRAKLSRQFAAGVTARATRVLALKARRGLAHCR